MTIENLLEPLVRKNAETLMRNGNFTLEVNQDVMRSFDRKTYYQVRSWLRGVRREMIKNSKQFSGYYHHEGFAKPVDKI